MKVMFLHFIIVGYIFQIKNMLFDLSPVRVSAVKFSILFQHKVVFMVVTLNLKYWCKTHVCLVATPDCKSAVSEEEFFFGLLAVQIDFMDFICISYVKEGFHVRPTFLNQLSLWRGGSIGLCWRNQDAWWCKQ